MHYNSLLSHFSTGDAERFSAAHTGKEPDGLCTTLMAKVDMKSISGLSWSSRKAVSPNAHDSPEKRGDSVPCVSTEGTEGAFHLIGRQDYTRFPTAVWYWNIDPLVHYSSTSISTLKCKHKSCKSMIRYPILLTRTEVSLRLSDYFILRKFYR